MELIKQVVDILDSGKYDSLFTGGQHEQPKTEASQNMGNLYEFLNCYSDMSLDPGLQDLHDYGLKVLRSQHKKHKIYLQCRTALRIIKYSNREPFSPHRDVTFSAFGIAAANSSQEIKLIEKISWGLQARELYNKPAFLHHFNTNGMKYYIGMFSTAPDTTEICDGLTIGQWMQQRYYYGHNH